MGDIPTSACKGKHIVVSGHDATQCVAAANWLLDHGARVTVIAADDAAAIEKRINEHLKRTASDGKAYEQLRARLAFKRDGAVTDLNALFLSLWKKKVIGVSGMHGKTTAAVWAAHLIGDAVVTGHAAEYPPVLALDSRARVAVIKLKSGTSATPKMAVVSTDGLPTRDAAIAAARLAGVPEERIRQRLPSLPQLPLRQEVVARSPKCTAVNDALATHPERGLFALRTWGGPTCVLICGGTDAGFDYGAWARELPSFVRRTNLVFLAGGATVKMRKALGEYGRGVRSYDSLEAAVRAARARARLYVSSVILYSPAAESFMPHATVSELGQQFSALVKGETW